MILPSHSKPRIALLLSGFVGSIQGKRDASAPLKDEELIIATLAKRHWDRYLLTDQNDIDIFIHTWSQHSADMLNDLFSPKSIVAEPPITNSKEMQYLIDQVRKNGIHCDNVPNTRMSQLITVQRSHDLYFDYSQKTGATYDYIIFARPDLCLNQEIPFQKLKPNSIYRMHTPFHDGPIHGYMDYPIICSSKIAALHYGNPAGYYLDKVSSVELTKPPNTLSLHRFVYHIFRILREHHDINTEIIPDMIFQNFYHSSAINMCRHLYFHHLDPDRPKGDDAHRNFPERASESRIIENIEYLKSLNRPDLKVRENY